MVPKAVILGVLAVGCLAAAAGGGFLAARQNARVQPVASTAAVPVLETSPSVAETEAIVEAPVQPDAEPEAPAAAQPRQVRAGTAAASPEPSWGRSPGTRDRSPARESRPTGAAEAAPPLPVAPPPVPEPVIPPVDPWTVERQEPDLARAPQIPEAPPEPHFVEVVVPASSVIGLQVETALTSERARIEDRVEARVTRDVAAGGRVAIPAGSRVVGSVTFVERGGKMKERARLGVRFHTVVFADGSELPLRTEPIFREGDAPSSESARKIGGAAAGGAIIGAILGGGKGAAIGGATGAAGGTAVVMAGDRNPATLPAGTVITVRLTEPVAVDVERR